MTREELVNFWIESSDRDFNSMQNMFKNKVYDWSLYVGHLVIEKLLKAYYIKNVDTKHPFIHNLLRLAEKSNLAITEEQKKILIRITTFNLRVKYHDYKRNFIKPVQKNSQKNG